MPYYPDINLLFIHIPKTGGTNIENNLKKITKQQLFSYYGNKLLPPPYNKISLQHQYYSTLLKYKKICNINFDNLKIFAIVRNPYHRIVSDLKWFNLINKDSDPDEVYNIIKNKYINNINLDNHHEPQYKFISDINGNLVPEIKIFYLEKLNESNEILNDFMGKKINIKKNNNFSSYMTFLNNNSIKFINSYYEKDFKLFNYNIIKI